MLIYGWPTCLVLGVMLTVIKLVSGEILRKMKSEWKVFDLVLMNKIMTNETAEPEEDRYDQHI
jgi:hypothetical protein